MSDRPDAPDGRRGTQRRSGLLVGAAVVLVLAPLAWAHTRTPWDDLDAPTGYPTLGDPTTIVPCDDTWIEVDHVDWREVQVRWDDCCNVHGTTFTRSWRGWERGGTFSTLAGCTGEPIVAPRASAGVG